jgi:hypothetical protein
LTLKSSIHGANSSNCIEALPASNPVQSGIVTRKPVIAPTSASQRCACASLSPPAASHAEPERDRDPDRERKQRHGGRHRR